MGKCKTLIVNAAININSSIEILKGISHRQLLFVGDDVDLRITYIGRYPVEELSDCRFLFWKKCVVASGYQGVINSSANNKSEYECFVTRGSDILIVINAENRNEAMKKLKREHMKMNAYFVSILSMALALSAYFSHNSSLTV